MVVGFSEESPADGDAEYFLLFEGSKWRHLTTARVIDPYTLHVVIPGEDPRFCELPLPLSVVSNVDHVIFIFVFLFRFSFPFVILIVVEGTMESI